MPQQQYGDALMSIPDIQGGEGPSGCGTSGPFIPPTWAAGSGFPRLCVYA
ncbi:uncharacterized protein VTP21DRAFT_7837 [Calcarisporiella thermophila]